MPKSSLIELPDNERSVTDPNAKAILSANGPLTYGSVGLIVCMFAVMLLAQWNSHQVTPVVWFSCGVVVRSAGYITQRWRVVSNRETRTQLGTILAFMDGVLFGGAAYVFSRSLSETALLCVLVILLSASLCGLTIHARHTTRSLGFLVCLWLPFFYRLSAVDADFGHYLILAAAVGLLTLILTSRAVAITFGELVAIQANQRQSRLDLQKRQSSLEKANVEQNIFFLAANHDIRQPLQAVALYAFALSKKLSGSTGETHDLLSKLDLSVKSLGNIIDETLRFAKIAAGEEQPKLTVFPAQAVIEKLRNQFGLDARQKNIVLRITDSEMVLFTDMAILERVLANLISNALRYTERGGVIVVFRRKGTSCLVQVWDTGIGIKEEDQARLFETFYQGSNRRAGLTGTQGGYGLGLSIVHRLCEQIGTTPHIYSVEQRGTRVSFTVPAASQSPVALAPPPAAEVSFNLKHVVVAIIEDDHAIRESLATVLRDCGAEVVAAGNVAELDRQLAHLPVLHYLVADLHIAGVLGTGVVRQLESKYQNLGSVIVTGDAGEDTLRMLRQEGFHMIQKPVDPQALLGLIQQRVRPVSDSI